MTFDGRKLPVTYHEHTTQFSGKGKGFNEQTDFNLWIHTIVTGDLLIHGIIRDYRIEYFANMIMDSIDGRN